MSKKTIYILIGATVAIIGLLIILSKSGAIGNKDKEKQSKLLLLTLQRLSKLFRQQGKFSPKLK